MMIVQSAPFVGSTIKHAAETRAKKAPQTEISHTLDYAELLKGRIHFEHNCIVGAGTRALLCNNEIFFHFSLSRRNRLSLCAPCNVPPTVTSNNLLYSCAVKDRKTTTVLDSVIIKKNLIFIIRIYEGFLKSIVSKKRRHAHVLHLDQIKT